MLIIGGGATGVGCALDSATRGLNTGLVEAEDFAAGTSSRSTKVRSRIVTSIIRCMHSHHYHLLVSPLPMEELIIAVGTRWGSIPRKGSDGC